MTLTPAVDFELNVQIQIASGSCYLYTRRDLISHSLSNNTTPLPIGSIILINQIEYQVSQFCLPGVVAHYNSKHTNTINSALNKRASFYCRAMIQSPTTQITIHPLLLDFLEQTLEYITLPLQHDRQIQFGQEFQQFNDADNDHSNTILLIEDQSSTVSFSIDSFTHS